MKDRRKHPRIDFRLPIEITGYWGLHMIRDFSLGGLFIETEASPQFETGDEIDFVVELPFETYPVQVRPMIARVARKAIGVEFVNLAPLHIMAIECCFHVFKHTIPLPGA